jgi:tetratricopeptide (TPR) repeat protein/transcriptional regulator with XRE-family HTH domain
MRLGAVEAGGKVGLSQTDSGFGRLLLEYRLGAGMTQEELAETSGLSTRAIANMERGRSRRPYRRNVLAVADALRLSAPQRELLVRESRSVPAASVPADSESGTAAAASVARQLPPAVSHFVGRASELAALTDWLEDCRDEGGTMVIAAIAGTAGAGKTGLATHWAHRAAPLFPDGQLYVNLCGYDPGPPVTSTDALAGFLRALGVPGRAIPAGIGELANRYRSLLAGRRMLILLDNARDAGQVRPLLPGTAGCLTIVTSRDSLAGLVARDGARRIELDALPLPDAVSLLRELVGARVEADPGAADMLAGLCCRLPLALRIAAELAIARPQVSLAELAAELADQQRQLDLLDAGGDQATAVQTVFSWSDRRLDPAEARAFRLLSLHPGPDIDAYAMAALTATTPQEASRQLSRLASAHLVQPTAGGRYGMHDLLRRYAADRAVTLGDRDEARARLLDYLQHTAVRAEALCQRDIRSAAFTRYRCADHAVPQFPDGDRARAWLRAERPTLLACLDQVTAEGQHARVVALTAGLAYMLRSDGPRAQVPARHAAAVEAARELGDRHAEAHALMCLADACGRTGGHGAASHALGQAREIFRDLDDDLGVGSALVVLSWYQMLAGDHQDAAEALREAHDIFRDLGDSRGVAGTLMKIGEVHRISGNLRDAAVAAAEAVAMFGHVGDSTGRAHALLRLGLIQSATDSYKVAAESFAEALSIYRAASIRMGQANALLLLGEAQSVSGDHDLALHHLAAARDIFRDQGSRHGEAVTMLRLGEALTAVGNYDAAAPQLAEALATFRDLREPISRGSALIALANLWRITGDYPASEQALADALAISRDLRAAGMETEILNCTGSLHRSRGDLEKARACHQSALRRSRDLAIPLEEGRALAGLGRCALSAGDHADALDLLRQAYDVLARTGAAEAEEIATELSAQALLSSAKG